MAKKTFKTELQGIKENAALSFISAPTEQPKQKQLALDLGAETKSKRLNLLIRPSLFSDIAKIAHMKRTSTNDLINTVLEEYRDKEAGAIEKYNATFAEEE